MPKRWRIHPHDAARVAALEREAGVSAVTAQLLICRGIFEPRLASDFLDPKLAGLHDPELMPGIPQAADLLTAAIADRRRIVVYGDYDADGITGTALLLIGLRLLGADATYYVPSRLDDGYGVHTEALARLAAQGARVVVTVDCGIASLDAALAAKDLGLDLVVTDHHEMHDTLPAAAAIVHPRLPGSQYPFPHLSGAGVAFKLAWALCQRASQSKKVSAPMRDFLVQAVGLAAVGTVADVVPLVQENRILVRHGLTSLKKSPTLGVERLMHVAKLDQKTRLDCEDIGFCLAPRLNAAGRLGQAQLAIELLTTASPERASALAEYLHELNGSRESLERSVYLGALKQAQELFDPENDAALVLAEREWHPGVIGLSAGRLAEKFHRPVVLIALDSLGSKPGIGSARSVPGLDLHQALRHCSQHLMSHGGHAAAAGLKIAEDRVADFRSDFCSYVDGRIGRQDRMPELWIDTETFLAALTLNAVDQIERLAPFGQGNSRPLLCATGVTLAEAPKPIGSGRHLAVKLSQHGVTLRGVAFGGGEWAEPLSQVSGPFDVAFRPVVNTFNGRRCVELHLVDWRDPGQLTSAGGDDPPEHLAMPQPCSSLS